MEDTLESMIEEIYGTEKEKTLEESIEEIYS